MSKSECDAVISEFMRRRGVTRCPTACAAPTYGTLAETDRAALRSHDDAREAARLQKLRAPYEARSLRRASSPGMRSPILTR
jgi:hypothetical protein